MKKGTIKAGTVIKTIVVLFIITLPAAMILGYEGYGIALAYCNGLSAVSGVILSGLQKLFTGLASGIASAV